MLCRKDREQNSGTAGKLKATSGEMTVVGDSEWAGRRWQIA